MEIVYFLSIGITGHGILRQNIWDVRDARTLSSPPVLSYRGPT